MNENRNSVIYFMAILASFVVFFFTAVGLFLPLVKLDGETITLYNTIGEIIVFFKEIKDINVDRVLKLTAVIRSAVVISLAVSLLVKTIIAFIRFLLRNIRNMFHPNDFYGADLMSICVQIAIFSMFMYAYYPRWDYAIGLELMTIAGFAGLFLISLLRAVEGLKSDEKLRGLFHAVFMLLAALSLYTVILIGMYSPVVHAEDGTRVAVITEITSLIVQADVYFSDQQGVIAFLLVVVALGLLITAFTNVGAACTYVLACPRKSRRKRQQHIQKEYHFRAILRCLLGLASLAASIVIIILKSPQAFETNYTIGRTGIISGIMIAMAMIFIVIAKFIRPRVNTFENAAAKEEQQNQVIA